VTTSSATAQAYFDQGLMFIYGFNHFEAARSFAEASSIDAACAMCYWGESLALGPHINAPMPPDATAPAFEALQAARQLAPQVSKRERAYIKALSARYASTALADRSGLDRAYANAMRGLVRAYPDDLDAKVLFAESLMNLVPWNYWDARGKPRAETIELVEMIEAVLERSPDHPGALHYYIHAIENSPEPARAEDEADRLRDLNIAIGHMIHMPAHIYSRVGRWHDASIANEGALTDDRRYLGGNAVEGMVPVLYHPHNFHFLSWTAGMEGRGGVALQAADALVRGTPAEMAADVPFLNNFLVTPTLTRIRFGKWDEILALPRPPQDSPFRVAIYHYARGLAFAAKGSPDAARAESARLTAIAQGESAVTLERPEAFFPGRTMLGIADRILGAEVALAAGDADTSIRLLEEAVVLQDGLAYMEPPYWSTSVRLALGRTLMRANRPAAAEAVYRADLAQYPGNGWALAGLADSLRVQQRIAEADEASSLFRTAWVNADAGIPLQ
jgi:tetratricopeptide (TPR) repeat protein